MTPTYTARSNCSNTKSVDPQSTSPIIVKPTAREDLVAKGKSEGGWIYRKTMEAELRLEMIRILIDKEVGFADVEAREMKRIKSFRNTKKVNRNTTFILKEMQLKAKDAALDIRKWNKKKCKFRRNLEMTLPIKCNAHKSLIRKLKTDTKTLKSKLQIKNKNKISHLAKKFGRKQKINTKGLERFAAGQCSPRTNS